MLGRYKKVQGTLRKVRIMKHSIEPKRSLGLARIASADGAVAIGAFAIGAVAIGAVFKRHPDGWHVEAIDPELRSAEVPTELARP
jgi:hypothetical protein